MPRSLQPFDRLDYYSSTCLFAFHGSKSTRAGRHCIFLPASQQWSARDDTDADVDGDADNAIAGSVADYVSVGARAASRIWRL